MKGRVPFQKAWPLLLLVLLGLAGCGGGGGGGQAGRGSGDLNISVRFDPATRNVPGYADRVRVTITLQGATTPLDPRVISRASDDGGLVNLRLESLPSGRHTIRAEALSPEPDSKVVAIAPPAGFVINPGETTPIIFSTNLATTIDRLSIDNAEQLNNPGIDVTGGSVQLGVRALSATDEVLLVNPGNGFRWTIDNSTVAEITEGGLLTPVGDGLTAVRVELPTSDGSERTSTPLRVVGPRGEAGFTIEWGAVTINKDIEGFIKGITARLFRNNIEIASANFNRGGRTDAFSQLVKFPGDFPYGANYELRLEGRNRSNTIIARASLADFIVPLDTNNPRIVSTIPNDLARLVFVRGEGGGIGGAELEDGESFDLSVNQTATFRLNGRTVGGQTILSHQDIRVVGSDPNIITVTDSSDKVEVRGVASGTATITASTDGGPSATLTVRVP